MTYDQDIGRVTGVLEAFGAILSDRDALSEEHAIKDLTKNSTNVLGYWASEFNRTKASAEEKSNKIEELKLEIWDKEKTIEKQKAMIEALEQKLAKYEAENAVMEDDGK